MLTRREAIQRTTLAGLATAFVSPYAAAQAARDKKGVWVNDKQSKLNRTRVARVVEPKTLSDIEAVLRDAKKQSRAVSVAGGRHAMGGQQFGTDTILLDTTTFNRVLKFDRQRGLVEVQAGIDWPQLVDYLATAQKGQVRPWSIRQKQTGVDRVTLGGTLGANAHGRGLKYPPIVSDVESFVLVDGAGKLHTCSRSENRELFSLAIGGYGLLGFVAQITLRLVRRRKVQRIVKLIEVRDLIGQVEQRLGEGFLFGDCQYSTDFKSDDPHQGVFSCYKPVGDDQPIKPEGKALSADQWAKLIYTAHVNKKAAFDAYASHYLSTDKQVYWSDTHQMSVDFGDYHTKLDQALKARNPGTEVITEVYVKRDALLPFMKAAKRQVREHRINLIYGTIRFIEKDEDTFLPWAKDQSVCVLCNLHVDQTEAGLKKAAADFRRLIQAALDHGGRYFLTYHRWATKKQVLQAYPQFVDFLRLKKKYDPQERFQSSWYRHYREMFRTELG